MSKRNSGFLRTILHIWHTSQRINFEWVDGWIRSYTNYLRTNTRTRTFSFLYWSNLHFSRKFSYQFEIFHHWMQTVFQFQSKNLLSTSTWTFNLEIQNELQEISTGRINFTLNSPNETNFFDSRDPLWLDKIIKNMINYKNPTYKKLIHRSDNHLKLNPHYFQDLIRKLSKAKGSTLKIYLISYPTEFSTL